MTADTYSNTLGYLIMGTGNDNNIWGTNANSAVFQILEDAIANALTSTVTGGTLDLSGSPPPAGASQTRYAALVFNGTLGSNQLVKVPNLTKRWQIQNATSGAFALQIQTPSGSPILIPQGMFCEVWCDGSNNLTRVGARTGEIFTHGAPGAPAGAAGCNGAALSRSIYSELYNIIGTTWGAGNGTTTFNVPNTQDTARFLRSSGAGLTVGTYQGNQNKSHTHSTAVSLSVSSSVSVSVSVSTYVALSGTSSGVSAWHTHTYSGQTQGENQSHTHSASAAMGGAFGVWGGSGDNQNATGSGSSVTTSSIVIGANNVDHSHYYTGTTVSNAGQDHTHTWSGAGTFGGSGSGSGTASGSGSGTFTSGTGSADGSEARPESAVVLMCIWV